MANRRSDPDPGVLLIASSYSAILFCQVGASVHLLHMLRQHLSPAVASSGVSAVAMGSIIGRLTVGRFADQTDKRRIAQILFLIQASSYVALSQSERAFFLIAASFCFGLTIGSVFMMRSLMIIELFGIGSFGTAFGVSNLVTSVAGGFGPLVVGILSSRAGGYPHAYLALTAVAVTGALLLSGVPRYVERQDDAQPAA